MKDDHVQYIPMLPITRFSPLHPLMRYMIDDAPNITHHEEPFLHLRIPPYINTLHDIPLAHPK